MGGVRHGLLVGVVLLVGSSRAPQLPRRFHCPYPPRSPKEGAAPQQPSRPAATLASPVSGLAAGLRSLFNLDKDTKRRRCHHVRFQLRRSARKRTR